MGTSKTKKRYAEALLNLSQRKPLPKITVQDLLDHTDTVRQTFYNHFKDKYDLFQWTYSYTADIILDSYRNSKDLTDCFSQICQFIYDNKSFFSEALKMNGQNNLMDEVFKHSNAFYKALIIANYGEDALSDEILFAIRYSNYAANNMIKDWLIQDLAYSPVEMSRYLLNSMPSKLKDLVK